LCQSHEIKESDKPRNPQAPIIVVQMLGYYIIIDGNHRFVRHVLMGHIYCPVKEVTEDNIKLIEGGNSFTTRSKGDITKLRIIAASIHRESFQCKDFCPGKILITRKESTCQT
jgi:hypothetical protein